MSQRNRSGRGSARNNGQSHGEEVQMWESSKAQLHDLITLINSDNANVNAIVDMDKKAGDISADGKNVPLSQINDMERLCRTGVKNMDDIQGKLGPIIEQLKVVSAVMKAKEQSEAPAPGPSKRAATRESTAAAQAAAAASAASAASLYEFDGTGDSPGPAPIGGGTRKHSERASTRERGGDRDRDRDSIPPKADSVEPQGSTGSAPGASSVPPAKTKVTFSKGDKVAFKPRAATGDGMADWIVGEVMQVLGEGKSRRYKVADIEDIEKVGPTKAHQHRTSASSMIFITPEQNAATLPDWEAGKTVLALYPNTTTFYKAEVHSTESGRVKLKFEGENDSTTLQEVERRNVIEYRA